MMKKRWSLSLMASVAMMCSCGEQVSPELDKSTRPPSAQTSIWFEPGDKITQVDVASMRLGLSGGYNLTEMVVEDMLSGLQLMNWETRAATPFDAVVEMNNPSSDSHASKTIYIDVTPRAPLGDAWYALQVSKSAQWQPRGGYASDDGYLYYRFTTKTAPMIRAVRACQKEQDVKITLDYSEAIILEDERLDVALEGSSCDRFGGGLAGGAASQVDYLCRSASDEASLTLSGLKSVVAASDASTGLVGADELVVELRDVELISECRQLYLEELPQ